jgi:hypothetical protein
LFGAPLTNYGSILRRRFTFSHLPSDVEIALLWRPSSMSWPGFDGDADPFTSDGNVTPLTVCSQTPEINDLVFYGEDY